MNSKASVVLAVVAFACADPRPSPQPAAKPPVAQAPPERADAAASPVEGEPEPPTSLYAFDPKPEPVEAWRKDGAPKKADQVWAQVWLREGESESRFASDDAWRTVLALDRHMVLCGGASPVADPPKAHKRLEVFFRNAPMTTASSAGTHKAWSLFVGLDGDSAGPVVFDGKAFHQLSDCSKCELAVSPLGAHLAKSDKDRCAKTIAARASWPKTVEPQHSQKYHGVYIAASNDPEDTRLAAAIREVAALGYNGLRGNVGCDTADSYDLKHGEHFIALYFASAADAKAFAKIRKPLWSGTVETYCLD